MAQPLGMSPQRDFETSPFAYPLLAIAQDPLGIVRRRWLWMLIALAVGTAGTAVLYSTRTPSYQASATVIVSRQQIPEDFVRSTVSGLDSLAEINSLLGEAFSQKFLIELIEEHGLYGDLIDNLHPASAATLMRESIIVTPQHNLTSNRRQNRDASVIIGISYSASDPKIAAAVTNGLAGNIIDTSIERRSLQAQGTTRFLRRELTSSEQSLEVIDEQMSSFRRAHRGEMPADLETLLRKLERLESRRTSVREQVTATQERLIQIENAEGVDSSPATVLAGLRMQLAQQLGLHTDEHPNVLALRRQISAVEDEMGELSRLLSQADTGSEILAASAYRELATLRSSLEETGREIDDLEDRVSRIPDTQDALHGLEERATVLRENYLEFLRKVQDAELAETLESAQQGPKVSILDPATAPVAPTYSRRRYLLLGAIASLMLVVGTGVLLELLDPVVLNRFQLEAIGGPPILGAVSRMD